MVRNADPFKEESEFATMRLLRSVVNKARLTKPRTRTDRCTPKQSGLYRTTAGTGAGIAQWLERRIRV